MTSTSDVLSIQREGAIATLWLDRPEKRNALSRALWQAIPGALGELAADEEVRAVILAGRGPSFCVGLDLKETGAGADLGDAPSQAVANLRQLDTTTRFQKAVSSLAECPLPVIAVVHGHCLGGGVDLITACDVRLAAADASFGIRETRIGIVADVGTLQRLPRIVSAGQVAELAYTGKDIDAARAEKIGLVNDVYPDFDAAYAAAREMAQEIAANPPLAVRGTKFVLQRNEDLTTEQSLLLNGLYTLTTSLQSNDLREAMKAFLEKRPPNFTGN
ncbi:MAG: enoyl-CoA hydratase/isomerase family protein [Proteobacteria bacterium]|nr:enoyl-CoA hydratase/isomerase family protein [Pseudomonadota bacterium]